MPNTKMRKDDWSNFFRYNKWLYVAIIAVVFLVTDVLYSATRYSSPDERQVNFQIVTGYISTEGTLEEVAAHALTVGQAYDPTLEEVVFFNIAYDPEDTSDTYGVQKYQLMIGVAEGDIYCLPDSLMRVLAREGYLLSLDDYIDSGLLDPGDADLSKGRFTVSTENGGTGREQLYAMPMQNMYGMMDLNYDNRNTYMVLMAYSRNPETSVVVMNDFLWQMTTEKPDWLAEAEAREPEKEPEDAFESVLQQAGLATPAPQPQQ